MKFSNLPIGARLGLGFFALCAFLAAVAAVGIIAVERVGHDVDAIVNDKWPKSGGEVQATGIDGEWQKF